MFWNGKGVRRDDFIAVRWFEKSAEQGNAQAMRNLGLMYEQIPRDDDKAFNYYEQAANSGDSQTQCRMGFIYELVTEKCEVDDPYRVWENAVYWYRKSAL